MSKKVFPYILILAVVFFVWESCSTQKNTAVTRWYHSTNTRYNIQYNAQVAYNDALKAKNEAYKDNMTEILYVFPFDPTSLEKKKEGGSFDKVVDKCVKAIKLHSIQKKPIKEANKRSNETYQNWYNQREFNPFLKNTWMLMAKAEYQNSDYLKAISTFSYITRLFKNDHQIEVEARIWMVKAYGELGWIYEAEDILKKIELSGGVPKDLEGEFAEANANLLLRQKKYAEAIPFLVKATDKSESHRQSIRLKYLLGQSYEKTGNRLMAYKAYNEIGGLNTPYLFEMNAQLKQAENSEPSRRKNNLSILDGMAKSSKNKEYLDQIYFAKGNIYMAAFDTANAISSYAKAVEKSTRKGTECARVQITLGDLYFQKRQYVKAQPCYSGALSVLRKDHEDYERVAFRSKILEQLAQYDGAIILQDSLQNLVRMPEIKRLAVIDKIIADVIKKEKEEKLLADKEKAEANATSRPGMQGQVDIPIQKITQGGFYYDNEQSIAQGKNRFQNKWGNRKLEDNWRRRDKAVSIFAESNESTPNDSTQTENHDSVQHIKQTNDKHQRDYYLQQLPFSKKQLALSDSIIDDAMFQMATIYQQQLHDRLLAIETYEKELNRFPFTPNRQEAYFRLYMLYVDAGNKLMASNYRSKMMSDFPKSSYAKSFADPNYEWNLQNPRALQNSLYEKAYNAYMKSDVSTVRTAYQDIQTKYPQSDLMPKFIFLNALTYAQTKETDKFRSNLREILEKYPESDVVSVAKDMLKESLSGKSLVGGNPMQGVIWNASFGKDATTVAQVDSTLMFKQNDDSEQLLLLVYPLTETNKNDLLYAVADYNFSHYIQSTFDLIFDNQSTTGILQVKGFSNFNYLKQYVNDALKNSLFDSLGVHVIPVPISIENYSVLQSGRTLNDYITFFNQYYAKSLPQITNLWKTQQQNSAVNSTPQNVSEKQTKPVEKKKEELPVIEKTAVEEVKIDMTPKKDINISNIKVENSIKEEPEEVQNTKSKKTMETLEKSINTAKEVYSNPVEGLKNIIKNAGNKPKLSKEEKAEQKEQQNLQKTEKVRLAKVQKEMEKTQKDSIASVRKIEKAAQRNAEKEKQDLLKEIENRKTNARKAKENARKAHDAELKEKERQHNAELKEKEKARAEKLKTHQTELKEKEQKRKAELKEKERLQKEKLEQHKEESNGKSTNK